MDSITTMFADIRRMRKLMFAQQIVNFALIVCSALILWKSLMVITGSESPIVVVLSGSMEPGFQRGDLLFLSLDNSPFEAGEILVFKLDGREIPIVHRTIKIHQQANGKVELLTKGDNNVVDDRGLYVDRLFLNRDHIIGRVKGFLPYIGMVTIIMNDYPQLKYAVIGLMGFFVLVNRE